MPSDCVRWRDFVEAVETYFAAHGVDPTAVRIEYIDVGFSRLNDLTIHVGEDLKIDPGQPYVSVC
jgi:hypothetical protein